MMERLTARTLHWFVGKTLIEIPETCSFVFFHGNEDPTGEDNIERRRRSGSIGTGQHWRLLMPEGGFRATSMDPVSQDPLGTVREAILGQVVERIQVEQATGDLLVTFSNGAQLEFLQMSCLYEAWRIWTYEGELVCYPGGEVGRIR